MEIAILLKVICIVWCEKDIRNFELSPFYSCVQILPTRIVSIPPRMRCRENKLLSQLCLAPDWLWDLVRAKWFVTEKYKTQRRPKYSEFQGENSVTQRCTYVEKMWGETTAPRPLPPRKSLIKVP